MAADGAAADWSDGYAIAENLNKHGFWTPGIIRLAPRDVLAIAPRKELIPPALCTQLRDLATELTGANSAAALRFAKRYIEIIDGRIDWCRSGLGLR
jgi:hypothetical protein